MQTIVFKLQQRSIRSPHIDAHYGLELQKYGHDWIISINAQLANSGTRIDMISADDKALIIVGEPGYALAPPVAHMRTTLATADAPSQAVDHNILKKFKIVPRSVMLDIAMHPK